VIRLKVNSTISFEDNVDKLKSAYNSNIKKALVAMGQFGVECTVDNMMTAYGRPIWVTGDLVKSITFTTDTDTQTLKLGSNMEYAPDIHEGTGTRPRRPFISDAILGHEDEYRDIAVKNLTSGINIGNFKL
jgi:phage gpG-like protein